MQDHSMPDDGVRFFRGIGFGLIFAVVFNIPWAVGVYQIYRALLP